MKTKGSKYQVRKKPQPTTVVVRHGNNKIFYASAMDNSLLWDDQGWESKTTTKAYLETRWNVLTSS